MEVRPVTGDSHLIVAFDTDDATALGTIVLAAVPGQIALSVTAADTWKVTRSGVYDLFIYAADGSQPVLFAAGKFTLARTNTRPRVAAA
jgi:hypothetical protein